MVHHYRVKAERRNFPGEQLNRIHFLAREDLVLETECFKNENKLIFVIFMEAIVNLIPFDLFS
jgi:hypothetical protein